MLSSSEPSDPTSLDMGLGDEVAEVWSIAGAILGGVGSTVVCDIANMRGVTPALVSITTMVVVSTVAARLARILQK